MASRKSATGNGARRKIPAEHHDTNSKSNSTVSALTGKRKAATSKVNGLKEDDNNRVKRKRVDSEVKDGAQEAKFRQPAKKADTSVPATLGASRKQTVARNARAVNQAPTASLDTFVFGDGSCAQLGLGSKSLDGMSPTESLVPHLNMLLSSEKVGVVQFACGGMHMAAITRDNAILTWGVNDLGALGRDTDVEEDDDDELNPSESVPSSVNTAHLEPDITWSQVVASDNASFALTDDGRVYGWGTFRSSDGVMGFDRVSHIQKTPILIPELKDIRQLAAGNDHVLALDGKGKVFTWGCGEKHQLARRTSHARLALRPTSIGPLPLPGAKASKVSCGSYHGFVIDQEGRVYAWGLNVFGELAIPDNAGEDGATQLKPRLVESLLGYRIVDIAGGEHHSLACTDKGQLLTWGRIDGHQVGIRADTLTSDNAIFDDRKQPRILKTPLVVPDLPFIVSVASGTDHSLALTADGKAYSWGFGQNGRTGQDDEEDTKIPTLIDSEAVRGRKLVAAGAGGGFSAVASVADLA
ncbi:RCC1/BLIP-II [Xylariaceae sp. FL0804]|nr:RCC1/BLIP-II [Xylariaceae sp. FL0804]